MRAVAARVWVWTRANFWDVTVSDARPWKRRREEASDDQGDAAAASSEWTCSEKDYRVSLQGLLHWLWCVVERGYVQRRGGEDAAVAQLARATDLLRMLVLWPLQPEGSPEVGVTSASAMCLTVLRGLRVDGAELCAFEERMRSCLQDKRAVRSRWERI